MNAIDTNVLVRIVVKDDVEQGERALRYVKKHNPVFLSHVVICEFSWVCVACYKFTKHDLQSALEHILRTNQFSIEDSELVWSALHEYQHNNLDFSDCLIGSIAKHNGSNKVGTFDKKAASSKLFELV